MSRKVSMAYRGAEGLACPRCHAEGRWVQLRNLGHRRRDDHRSPDGVSYEPIVLTGTSDRRLYPDDERVDTVERIAGGNAHPVTLWRHHYTLQCPIHPTAYNRRAAVPHDFADDELPDGYWQREVPDERD